MSTSHDLEDEQFFYYYMASFHVLIFSSKTIGQLSQTWRGLWWFSVKHVPVSDSPSLHSRWPQFLNKNIMKKLLHLCWKSCLNIYSRFFYEICNFVDFELLFKKSYHLKPLKKLNKTWLLWSWGDSHSEFYLRSWCPGCRPLLKIVKFSTFLTGKCWNLNQRYIL